MLPEHQRRAAFVAMVAHGLVRAIAEWHEGEVGAECEDGRTTFWIELPAESTVADLAVQEQPRIPRMSASPHQR